MERWPVDMAEFRHYSPQARRNRSVLPVYPNGNQDTVMDPHNPDQLRTWLTQVVRPALDDFIAAPLEMRSAHTATIIIYQYHEALFYCLTRAGQAPADNLAEFRRMLAAKSAAFGGIAGAIEADICDSLSTTSIVTGSAFFNDLEAEAKVRRAIIVTKIKRQLIPLLEDVMMFYGRLLTSYGL
jgi:hypothetical protein